MKLKEISIENFKSIDRLQLQLNDKFNAFTGRNGIGKTNILDAIYLLSAGKSYFNSADFQLIRNDENYFSIRGQFQKADAADDVLCVLIKGRKKVIKKNDVAYERLVEHYGCYPLVMIAPDDIEIISGGSEGRRRWMDSVISIHDMEYLVFLMKYEKILLQRNAELKKMYLEAHFNREVLNIYDGMMIPLAESIFDKRKKFIAEFIPIFSANYDLISGKGEEVGIQYQSQLLEAPLAHFLEFRFKQDLALQRTNNGTHKDELEFTIFAQALKKFGSQGQQKTFIFSLKLSQHKYIMDKTGIAPILLLDDVCERLDDSRISNLMNLIGAAEFGQVFLTDTSAARIHASVPASIPMTVFDVEELVRGGGLKSENHSDDN